MLIDWFTVAAQIVNFIILVWLLKRFLYKPVLHAIDERQKAIAAKRAEAEDNSVKAKKVQAEFEEKSAAFEQQRGELLKKAGAEAKAERESLVEEARQEAAAMRTKFQTALTAQLKSINNEIITRTQREVLAIARQALKDLANADVEALISEEFVRRLENMTVSVSKSKSATLKETNKQALVRSSFGLTPKQRQTIESAIKKKHSISREIRFEVVTDLIGGIELIMDGQKTAWSISGYLDGLSRSIGEVFGGEAKTASPPISVPSRAPVVTP
jgi:F-type H+-transporting ATPase subunit b